MERILCFSPVLRSPDFTQPFIVQADASDQGVKGVLSQQDENGEEHPVVFFSQKLLQQEEHNSTVEKELLTIKALQDFHMYPLGRPFVIQTNHQSFV